MQAIRTKYYGPTNSRGSRIQAKCEAKAIFVPYAHELNIDDNHKAACEELIRQMGWTSAHGNYSQMVGGYFNGDRYWVFLHEQQMGMITDVGN